jgi:hypothetical protein
MGTSQGTAEFLNMPNRQQEAISNKDYQLN